MADRGAREIRAVADFLLQNGYMYQTAGEYPVVGVTEKAKAILFGGEKALMAVFADAPDLKKEDDDEGKGVKKGKKEKEGFEKGERKKAGKPGGKAAASRAGIDGELFDKLKELRLRLAKEANAPAFVVFSDAALVDMCARMPDDEASFLEVSGVGKVKLERYGAEFLSVIRDHKDPGF